MRLAVLAAADPLNIRTWSGTPYFMTKTLQAKFPDLFPVRTPRPVWFQYLRRVARQATAGRIDISWNRTLALWSANHLASRLKAEHVDVAFCIANAPLSAFLAEQLPTIHVSDATVPLMRDYYAEFSSLPKALAFSAWQLDSTSVLRSSACLFSTEWAARSAIRDYGADPSRVHAIPWGANVDPQDVSSDDRTAPTDVCHLVFIGVDWDRKGGAIAVAAALRLSQAGHAVKLHIVGAKLNFQQQSDAIIIHGFINKSTEDGRLEFDRIMRQAAFLFVPTRQDCSPMVFPEANSYGVPVITTQTGGVPDVVHEGINGHLLPIEATADAYADLIWTIWSDRSRYDRLRKSSRTRFDHVLNWNSWLSAAAPVIEDAAACGPAPSATARADKRSPSRSIGGSRVVKRGEGRRIDFQAERRVAIRPAVKLHQIATPPEAEVYP
jgi:glycosyltransferase involved in cell wall biosynthesis